MSKDKDGNQTLDGIAIVGMAGKFPGVESIHEYWNAIVEGKELLKRFSDEELNDNGVSDESKKNKHFVPVNGLIQTAEYFDSGFFGFTPREADLTDPQHRKFLEVCYEALEHAGQSPDQFPGSIGVFAGCSMNNYLLKNLLQHPELLKNNGEFQTIVNNDKDFLTTKVSYKLNLTGPSYDIQTACSTSLVAIHAACQNLLNYQCDIALGGGAYIMNPRGHGYMFKPGGIESSIGKCRPFDKDSEGTVFGEGVGVIALKRLEDAVADKDEIWAVIKSSAINNDGSFKIGYMAPSADGQADVISRALSFGEIDARSISYVEAHGTGTTLGDPIELSGLTTAFREHTEDTNFCAIGSVKGNIGHCDVAAGVAGIIKTAMALKYKKIPPSINFNAENPELYLDSSPFYVNTQLKEWDDEDKPRRASISSFGIGGTNAHCILESWENLVSEPSARETHLLPLSAKSSGALDRMIENLVQHVQDSTQEIGDIAHTLQAGRNFYSHKALLIGKNKEEIVGNYTKNGLKSVVKGKEEMTDPAVVFMFTGQGSQYVNMAKGLYDSFELYKNIIDEAHEVLSTKFDINLLELLFNDAGDKDHREKVNLTANTQALLFTVQYATACLLIEHGIFPDALVGHSIGELTAATLSGVFSFDDALSVVANRGRIMQEQKLGAMLSVNLSADQLKPYLTDKIELALQNAPNYSVVSGSVEDIADFEQMLKEKQAGVHATVLKTSHAFHSRLMEPALQPFIEVLKNIDFQKPEIPFISNVTGKWITTNEACSPEYWANHIRSTVMFSDGLNQILHSESEAIFLEVGPGNTLSMLLSQYDVSINLKTISTIRHPRIEADDKEMFNKAIAEFWITGGPINWYEMYEDEDRFKVPLPTYPFEQKRHWIDPLVNINYYSGENTAVNTNAKHESNALTPSVTSNVQDASLHERPELDTAYIAPSSDTEMRIVGIWQELLGIKGIGLKDDFFDLGGHSLLASQLVVRINENFNVKIPLDGIFSSSTIQALIDTYKLEVSAESSETNLKHGTQTDNFPLSREQKRLWLINKIDQNNPAYNIPFTYRLKGDVNVEVLTKSFQLLVDRHLTLKSYITTHEGEAVSRVSNKEYQINFRDISKENITDVEAYVQDELSKDTRESFVIEEGPLIRVNLLKLAEAEFIFHLTVQHMVFDGWSWGIFSKELSMIYNALIEKKEVSLPDLDIQYFDFSQWQRDNEGSVSDEKSIEFWKEQLKDVPLETKFPYDKKRPKLISGLGGRESIKIDKELSDKIRNISKESGATVFMTMLSAFGALISLYSHENDICIGTPTANRTRSKFEKIIGFFVNTIVFRLKFDKSLSFSKILGSNKKTFIDSLEHQDLSFEKLVDELQPERVLNINPLFQIMFAWQNSPRPPMSLNGVEPERVVLKNGISPLDITFYMWENEGEIEGEIEFNVDILERESIVHLKHNYVRLLEEIAAQPEQPLSDLTGISEYTREKLSAYNNTSVDLPEKLLHELLEEMAVKHPDKEAVKAGSVGLSYQKLNEKVNSLAHDLIQMDVKDSFIGVSLPRTEQMLITILAILKAGANYLPLDPSFPDERLKYILSDSKAKILITNKELRSKFRDVDTQIVLIEKLTSILKFGKRNTQNPKLQLSPESLAYTIYTSGSTGNPKGVKVPHRAAVNFILSMAKDPGLKADDRLLAVTTLSFDISVLEVFLPLAVGACVVIAETDDVVDGKKLIELIEKESITMMQATPSTWNLLLLSGWRGKENLRALCGGEALPVPMVKGIYPKVKELWNMYGPTETTVWSTCKHITDPNDPIWVGTPIDNTQIYILDEHKKEMPQDVYGEVCIGGKGVTAGYHNRSALTADKFIAFKDGETIYRTGDWGRILSNGSLEIARRIDNQIKLRGFRIEPGEIEALISNGAGVKETVVKTQKFGDYDERLIAFVRTDTPEELDGEQIRSRIGSRLPKYMIPSNIVVMEDFPRTPNGKVNRNALVYDADSVATKAEIVLPSTQIQEDILEVWQEILKSKSIGIKDNFFDIGGNSLLALTVVEKMQKKLNVDINVRIFFDSPIIKDIADTIEQNNRSEVDVVSDEIDADIVEGSI